MPTVQNTDDFVGASFAVPGTGPYIEIGGTPTEDNSVVPPGQTASMNLTSAAANEYVGYQIPTPGTYGWIGFYWRLNAANEPASLISVCIIYTAGFSANSRISYIPASNELEIANGVDFERTAVSLDAWHWIELILDVSTTTRALYARVDGVDFTGQPVTDAGSITTVNYVYPGHAQVTTTTQRFGYFNIGTAASVSDWLGEPSVAEKQSYYATRRRTVGRR